MTLLISTAAAIAATLVWYFAKGDPNLSFRFFVSCFGALR